MDILDPGLVMTTLTKASLCKNLTETIRINKRDAYKLVEIFFEEIHSLLEEGHQVRLSGFGNFKLRDKKARPGRNPKTKESTLITARRVVTFRAGEKLNTRVN